MSLFRNSKRKLRSPSSWWGKKTRKVNKGHRRQVKLMDRDNIRRAFR